MVASVNKINRLDLEALEVQLPTTPAQVGQIFYFYVQLAGYLEIPGSVCDFVELKAYSNRLLPTVFGSGATNNTGGFGTNNNTGGGMFGGGASSGFGSNAGGSTGMSMF